MNPANWDDVTPRLVEQAGLSCAWRNLGNAAGTVGVGLRLLDIPPHGRPTPPHRHGAEEEIFYILGGTGLSWQDGSTCEIGPRDVLVHRAGREAHTLIAGPDGLRALVFGERLSVEFCVLPRANAGWIAGTWTPAGLGPDPWDLDHAAGDLAVPPPSARPKTVRNVDDVEGVPWGSGTIAAIRRDVGRAAGSVRTGLKHVTVEPHRRATTLHCHSAEEEIFVVLGGGGTLRLRSEPDPIRGDALDESWPLREGSVVSRPPGTGVSHCMTAGPDGLELLAYGTRDPSDICYYPDSGKVFIRGIGLCARVERLSYWDGEGSE